MRRLILSKMLFKIALDRPAWHIDSDGDKYLYRIFMGEHGDVKCYLHWFVGVDNAGHVHNHPFDGLSIILCGAYKEVMLDPHRYELLRILGKDVEPAYSVATRRFWNRVDPDRYHRISDVKEGTWTLFFAGKSNGKGWYFVEEREVGPLKYTRAPKSGDEWWKTAHTLRQLLENDPL